MCSSIFVLMKIQTYYMYVNTGGWGGGGGGVVFVIVWQLDLQLHSVHIVTNVVSSNLPRRDALNTTLCDKVSQSLEAGRWLSPGLRFPP